MRNCSVVAYPRIEIPMVARPAATPIFVLTWYRAGHRTSYPKLTEDAIVAGTIDKIIPVDGKKALQYTRELAQKEGIFCGVSSGATFTAAMEVARSAPAGSNILCMLPDTGERYLSTPLFDDIVLEMSEEEWEVSRSTPNYRFDAATTGKPVAGTDEQDESTARPG